MSTLTITEFILARVEEERQGALRQVLIDPLHCPVCEVPVGTYFTPATIFGRKVDRPDRVEPCNHELTPEQADACHRTVISSRVDARCKAMQSIVGVAQSPWFRTGEQDGLHYVLAHLASIWSDHPDYRDEWAS